MYPHYVLEGKLQPSGYFENFISSIHYIPYVVSSVPFSAYDCLYAVSDM
jgi:hypothetical protein